MAPATIQPADTDAVSLEEGPRLCGACRSHVSVAPCPASFATEYLAVPKAACPNVDQPTCAELHSPAAPLQGSCAKEPTSGSAAAPRFDCSICLDACQDPVVTHCGHLFCWPCLYSWLSAHSLSYECPVCRAAVRDKIVPLYGRGELANQPSPNSAPASSIFFPEVQIPRRPVPRPSPCDQLSATAAADADAALNHAIHQRGIYHSLSVDYAALGSGLAAPYTVADHVVHHRGVSNRRRRSGLHGRAAAGSPPGMKICVAHFLAWVLSRCSSILASASSPAAYYHSVGVAYADETNIPVRRGGRRYNGNEKLQFVLHWALICVVTITSVCLICA